MWMAFCAFSPLYHGAAGDEPRLAAGVSFPVGSPPRDRPRWGEAGSVRGDSFGSVRLDNAADGHANPPQDAILPH